MGISRTSEQYNFCPQLLGKEKKKKVCYEALSTGGWLSEYKMSSYHPMAAHKSLVRMILALQIGDLLFKTQWGNTPVFKEGASAEEFTNTLTKVFSGDLLLRESLQLL